MGLDPTEGPRHTTGLIGGRRKRGDALTRAVLIGREAWPYCPFPLRLSFSLHAPSVVRCVSSPCPRHWQSFLMPVAMAWVPYPFPSRTRKSSPTAPMIVALRRESRRPPAFFYFKTDFPNVKRMFFRVHFYMTGCGEQN